MKWWIDFVNGFNGAAGNIVACLILVLFLTPFLYQGNPKAWEALTFILGIIGGMVRGASQEITAKSNSEKNQDD